MPPPTAILLGAAVWPDGQPSPALRRRAARAAELYHAGEVARIIATGGLGDAPPSEAEAARLLLSEAGVPAEVIALEAASRSTLENLALAKALLDAEEAVVIVSDLWHLPRARLIARRLGLMARGAAPPLRGAHPGRVAKAVLREVAALGWYLLRGLPRA